MDILCKLGKPIGDGFGADCVYHHSLLSFINTFWYSRVVRSLLRMLGIYAINMLVGDSKTGDKARKIVEIS